MLFDYNIIKLENNWKKGSLKNLISENRIVHNQIISGSKKKPREK